MQTQEHIPSSGTSKTQNRGQLPWGRIIISIVVSLVLLIATVLGILEVFKYVNIPNYNSWSGAVLGIIVPMLGAIFGLLQWILPFNPVDQDKQSSSAPSIQSDPSSSSSPVSPPQQSLPADVNTIHSNTGTPSSSADNVTQSTHNAQHKEVVDFLISYTDADEQCAEWVAGVLEEASYSTILRSWDFELGSNFLVEMNDATKRAKRTLLLLSPDYIKDFDKHPEWTEAFRNDMAGRHRKLLPVYVRECKQQVGGLLGSIVSIDIAGKSGEEARELLLTGVRPGGRRPLKYQSPPHYPGSPERV